MVTVVPVFSYNSVEEKKVNFESDFRDSINEIFCLLGCCVDLIGSWLPTFRDKLSVPSSRVKRLTLYYGTHRLSRNVGKNLSTLRNILGDRRFQVIFIFIIAWLFESLKEKNVCVAMPIQVVKVPH
jgi:hypothetical protein